MARSDPGGRSRLARWSRWAGGRVALVVAALVASVGAVSAQPAAAVVVEWRQVAVGERHTCGIKENDTLWCWGRNNFGQLGLGNTTDRSVPTQVGTDTDWVMVTVGGFHTCALKTDQKIRYCWGDNYSGSLGLGTNGTTNSSHRKYLSPTTVGDDGWESLSAADDATCGIRTQYLFSGGQLTVHKRLLCWGDNNGGWLGVNSQANAVVNPTLIAGGGQWTTMSLGPVSACGLRSDGQVSGERYCWGVNEEARLGLGWEAEPTPVTVPTPVPGDGSWSTVTMGNAHGCGISVNRRAYCWGDRAFGAVGLGEPAPGGGCCVLAPGPRLPGTSWAQIDAGDWSTCGLTTNGTRLCWGRNTDGQLGLGDTQHRYTPVETNEGSVWASLSVGNNYACGIRKNGALFCWGSNTYGKLGSSQVPVGGMSTVPVQVN